MMHLPLNGASYRKKAIQFSIAVILFASLISTTRGSGTHPGHCKTSKCKCAACCVVSAGCVAGACVCLFGGCHGPNPTDSIRRYEARTKVNSAVRKCRENGIGNFPEPPAEGTREPYCGIPEECYKQAAFLKTLCEPDNHEPTLNSTLDGAIAAPNDVTGLNVTTAGLPFDGAIAAPNDVTGLNVTTAGLPFDGATAAPNVGSNLDVTGAVVATSLMAGMYAVKPITGLVRGIGRLIGSMMSTDSNEAAPVPPSKTEQNTDARRRRMKFSPSFRALALELGKLSQD